MIVPEHHIRNGLFRKKIKGFRKYIPDILIKKIVERNKRRKTKQWKKN